MNGCLIFSHSRHTRSHDDGWKKWLRLLLKYGHNEGLMHTGNGCWGEIAARDELDYVFGEGARRVVILIFLTIFWETPSLARLTFLDSGESGGSSAVAPMTRRCWDASSLSRYTRIPCILKLEIVCVRICCCAAGVSVRAHVFLLIYRDANADIWSTRIFPAAALEIRSAAGDNKELADALIKNKPVLWGVKRVKGDP